MTVTGSHIAGSQTGDPAAQLVSRLSDPQVVGALNTLLDHVDLLALLVAGLNQMVERSEVIGDSLAAGLTEVRGTSPADIDIPAVAAAAASLAKAFPKITPALVEGVESGAVDKLLATAVVSAGALPQVEMIAEGVVKGDEQYHRNPVQISGPLSLVKLLRDPDVSRALSYFATIAKAVGQQIARKAAR